MRATNHNLSLLFALVLIAALATPALAQQPDLNTILDRMEQAEAATRAQAPAYTVTRAYRFYAADSAKPNSEVIAKVDYQPPASKTYNIEQQTGSDRGAKIVRKVLDHETEAAKRSGNPSDMTRENYDFTYAGASQLNGTPAFILNIKPKHNEKDTIKGQLWLDARTYLPLKVEGDLAKSPSWWIKDVHLVLNFGRIAGVWLQTATVALADVRFFGQHTMVSQAVSCHPNSDAAGQTGYIARRSSASPSVATAVFRP